MNVENILNFLSELKENNDKEWFDQNRSRYQKVKKEFESVIQEVIDGLSLIDESIADQEPKKCIFRIFRDVRFSKNKTPYKTNFGAFISKEGRKSHFGGYYLHLEPGKCMIAGGSYMPEAEALKKIRQEIDYNADDFLSILNNKDFSSNYGGLVGDQLKTAPKGYPKDHPQIELLRFKSFIVSKSVSDKDILAISVDDLVQQFSILKPFNDFLNVAIKD
ncbi:DUF2461 domain-containing protein [Sediminitomix flava]|uniref:Uncharacterized protein (TIGR02453 family) n=1 Tax=Sediminitomix flava TaxID=379075 RepID=A0A315ZB25_SEDFL|nr:DUF2461 domain-containing protein [Sediminitomix flava]PWJ42359.1 uncharacterized protein (TIGR02453 family) [Sediminitomix flava]